MFRRCIKIIQIMFCAKFALCCFCQSNEADKSSWFEKNNHYKIDVDSSYATYQYYQKLEDNWRTRAHVVEDAKKEISRRFTKRLVKFYGQNTKTKLKYEYVYKPREESEKAARRGLAAEQTNKDEAQKEYENKTERLRINVKPRLFKGYVVMEVKNHFFEVEGVFDFGGDHELAFYKPIADIGIVSELQYRSNDDQITAKIHKPINENWSMQLYQSFANSGGDPNIPGRDTGLQVRYAVDF